jgi:hypothetical protein
MNPIAASVLLGAFFAIQQQQAQPRAFAPVTEVVVVDETGHALSDVTVSITVLWPSRSREIPLIRSTDFGGFYFTDAVPADAARVCIAVDVPPRLPGVPGDCRTADVPYKKRMVFPCPIPRFPLTCYYRPAPPSRIFSDQEPISPIAARPDSTWVTIPQRRPAHVASAFRDGSMTPERIRIPFADEFPPRPMPVVRDDRRR